METGIVENTKNSGFCKDCEYYTPCGNRIGWCELWCEERNQSETCRMVKKKRERLSKCKDCIRYKAISNSIGRCQNYLGRVRNDSICKRFIKKGKCR